MIPQVPHYSGPASIGALVMLAGVALLYWSLTGLGVISGSTPKERVAGLKEKLTTR